MQHSDFVLVGLMAFALLQATAAKPLSCYATEKSPYLYFASKTPYFVTQLNKPPLPSMKGCKPMQLWIAIRHGTRYPQKKNIIRMQDLPKFRDQVVASKPDLCKEDLALLKNWKINPNMVVSKAGFLTEQGEKDMQIFGNRLRSSFPDLFNVPVNAQNYKIRSTKTQRTENSMLTFMQGFFNSKSAVKPELVPDNDILLNGYKNCPAWENSLITDKVDKEAEELQKSKEFNKFLENLSARLRVPVDLNKKSANSVKMLYDTCRFEKSWAIEKVSPWCAIFSKEELQLLEYHEDLEHYYESGPGREINKKLGCPMLQDMFTHFEKLEKSSASGPKGIFYFTHMVPIQALMTTLNIGKDKKHLTAKDYASVKNRKFRTSMISSFASNFAAVFYSCTDKSSPHKVLLMVNERPVDVEGCKGGVCDWKTLKKKFGPVAQCDPNFCNSRG